MTKTAINPEILFLDEGHEGGCCACCDDYCTLPAPDWFYPRVRITVGGVEYVGTNRLLIRRDALAPLPESFLKDIWDPTADVAWAVVPEQKPPGSDRLHVPWILDRLDLAGLTSHDGDDICHLYAGDEHAGWTKWARDDAGCRPEDLELVRKVSAKVGVDLRAAHAAVLMVRELG